MRAENLENDKIYHGRIRCYMRKAGYGFIRMQDGTDVHFYSSDFVDNKSRFAACIGSVVTFTVETVKGTSRVKNITVDEQYPNGDKLVLLGGPSFDLSYVDKVGVGKKDEGPVYVYIKLSGGNEYIAHANTLRMSPTTFMKHFKNTYVNYPPLTD